MSDSVTRSELAKPKSRWAKSRMKVLIVTDNPAATQEVLIELRQLGLDVQLSLYDGQKLAAIPNEAPGAVLCFFTDFFGRSQGVSQAIRAHYSPKTPPIIGALERPIEDGMEHFDSLLFAPVHSSQIANRVDSMIRLGEMEVEITRRIETLNEAFDLDVSLPDHSLNRPFRILFIGKAAPGFMIVINALQEKNVETVAAFTSFSAFDYLHDRQFDAVVMNALEQPEPALTISETMRRNSKLYHVPTLFLVDPETFTHRDEAYERGARDLISVNSPPEEINGRILELANYYRIHEQFKATFGSLGGSICVDEESGLYNADFFDAHMARVTADCHIRGQALTLLALRPQPKATTELDPIYLRAAMAKVGGMLKNLIRMQDIIARYDTDTFILAFPGASEEVVSNILSRIESLISCAAFESGDVNQPSFTFTLDASIATNSEFEDSEMLVARTITGLKPPANQADIMIA